MTPEARLFVLHGQVQGVGFRPFILNLARQLGLTGRVRNASGGVEILAEGPVTQLECFARAMLETAPPLARPRLHRIETVQPSGALDFVIDESMGGSSLGLSVPPDLFVCDTCRAEMQDPHDRRHHYPFINCTQCGPRYTIIEKLPYDRASTTMRAFVMCPDCQAEYDDPTSRRFHAQPNACAQCGPKLTYHARETDQENITHNETALAAAVAAIRRGLIVAVRGVGGYHLMCDATSQEAVTRLRKRKCRPDKPLAVMFPERGADGLQAIRLVARINRDAAKALRSPARPIVLLPIKPDANLAEGIAPGLAELGALLPYSPVHTLLLEVLEGPVVATSGNISGEPVITDSDEADQRLTGIADTFLHHDRPIARPADDSVLRNVGDGLQILRAGRGLAPLELELPCALHAPLLALGGQMKTTIALGVGQRLILSPHIGDMSSQRAQRLRKQIVGDFGTLYGAAPKHIVSDAHPGFSSRHFAERQGLPCSTIQHHAAHASALTLERPKVRNWLVLTWDGVGFGADGTLWGGEAMIGRPGEWCRAGSWRPFAPPGGDKAAREAWRSAAALCWADGRDAPRLPKGGEIARQAWQAGINAPQTSAVGRLFDAAAAIVLGVTQMSYEGQGPMLLEAAAAGGRARVVELPIEMDAQAVLRIDWTPLLDMLFDGCLSQADKAASFHASTAEAAARQIDILRRSHSVDAVGATGGVFQNRRLVICLKKALKRRDIDLVLPSLLPGNDGGLAAGQIVEFAGLARKTQGQTDG